MLHISLLSKMLRDRPISISRPDTTQLLPLAAGILTVTLFALTPTTTRLAIAQLKGLDIGLFRVVGSGVIAFILIALFRIRPPYERGPWQLLVLFSIGSFTLFPMLFSIGAQNTSAVHASLIM